MLSTKITRKGQVTIPVEIRNKLNLQEGDILMVAQRDGKVILTNPQDIVKRTAGAFAKYAKTPPPTPEEMRQAFEEGVAAEVAASMEVERE